MMKVGDIVNVKKLGVGYWKGKITKVSPEYTSPIATVNEIGGSGHAVFTEHRLRKENGEWWQR